MTLLWKRYNSCNWHQSLLSPSYERPRTEEVVERLTTIESKWFEQNTIIVQDQDRGSHRTVRPSIIAFWLAIKIQPSQQTKRMNDSILTIHPSIHWLSINSICPIKNLYIQLKSSWTSFVIWTRATSMQLHSESDAIITVSALTIRQTARTRKFVNCRELRDGLSSFDKGR